MQPISRNTSTHIFKQDYISVTTLSINALSDFVVGPRMRNFRVTTARKSYLLVDFFIQMKSDLSIYSSSVRLNSGSSLIDPVVRCNLTHSLAHSLTTYLPTCQTTLISTHIHGYMSPSMHPFSNPLINPSIRPSIYPSDLASIIPSSHTGSHACRQGRARTHKLNPPISPSHAGRVTHIHTN